ncbi:uncharacterized protein K452DRAFT_322919 [Aplosporella prunicola CBS 121167]|uniref:AA1-like domain-containing protein n=1 Tax=Aplosporella prunicola CBS 121167 TaxID=1176127 RepID=A0A6A6AXJ6_9PEZI|nr:uncharacterized protein K452DRAFT_322919 [Aplosporella prunicola CBS 121167]KAF2135664.1 hypothetical protein K452DRAFT_322919 [Aplosporella prunicola CBS 121167]
MQLSTLLLGVCAVFSTGALSAEYFNVTNTYVTYAARPPQSEFIGINVYDPSSSASSDLARCEDGWYTSTTEWPHEFVACDVPSWSWYLSSYTSKHDFDVELSHSFDDSEPTEDGLTWHRERFGRFSLTDDDFNCSPVHSGMVEQCRTGPRDVPVYNETYTNGNGTVFWRVP